MSETSIRHVQAGVQGSRLPSLQQNKPILGKFDQKDFTSYGKHPSLFKQSIETTYTSQVDPSKLLSSDRDLV